jgi:Fe2+ transport system protein FeoA
MKIVKLGDVFSGQKAKVVKVGGDVSLRKRLLDMGIIPGCSVKVERVAPLGDPVEITVRGYSLSLRKKEAGVITVEL